MEKFKEYAKVISLTVLSTIAIFIIIPMVFGYKLSYSTDRQYDFEAMSAWGTILGALIPLLLVLASHIVTKKVDESNERTQREVQESNAITVDYVKSMVDEAFRTNPQIAEQTEEILHGKLKDKAYRYVSLQGICNTQRVADHLNIDEDQAFDILEELLKFDGLISAGG